MARQIFGTRGYRPNKADYVSTQDTPLVKSDALKGLIDSNIKDAEKDIDTMYDNASGLRSLNDMLDRDVSPSNKARYNELQEQLGVKDLGQNLNVKDMQSPTFLNNQKQKIDRFFGHHEVERIKKSGLNAENFYRQAQGLNNPNLRDMALSDYKKAYYETGADDMLGLDIEKYKDLSIIDETDKAIKKVGTRESLDRGGLRYQITKANPQRLTDYLQYKYETDDKFRNNFKAKFKDKFENIEDYVNFLNDKGALTVDEQYSGKSIPKTKSEEESSEPETLKELKGTYTSDQKKILEHLVNTQGIDLNDPYSSDIDEQVKDIVRFANEQGFDFSDMSTLMKSFNESKATPSSAGTEDTGGRINISGIGDISPDDLKETEEGISLYRPTLKGTKVDMSHKMFYSGNPESLLGAVEEEGVSAAQLAFGEFRDVLNAEKSDPNYKYKGYINEDGDLVTSNIRWVYEDYYGKTQSNEFFTSPQDDPAILAKLVKEDPNVQLLPKGGGKPPRFVIKSNKKNTGEVTPRFTQDGNVTYDNLVVGSNEIDIPNKRERPEGKKNVSWYTNNPLNIKGAPSKYPVIKGVDEEGSDSVRHRVFSSLEEGFNAGVKDIEAKLNGNSSYVKESDSLSDLYKVFATGANKTKIDQIAGLLGVSSDITLEELRKQKTAQEVTMAILSVESPEIYEQLSSEGPRGDAQETEPTDDIDLDTVGMDNFGFNFSE